MHKLEAVFWDVDGTMADTELCGHRIAFNLAFKDFDLDWNWNESKYVELLSISGGLNRIIHFRNEINSDLSESVCSEIQSRKCFYYKRLIQEGKVNLRNGVLRLIKELYTLGVEQFIVTTSGKESLEPFLNNSLTSHLKSFSGIITYEDVEKHKPFPDAYKLALKLSKKPEENCIAIEDSHNGVEAAKAANLNCLLSLPPWRKPSENISKKANACVSSLGDSNNFSKVIYGKPLIKNIVDFNYLSKIIN